MKLELNGLTDRESFHLLPDLRVAERYPGRCVFHLAPKQLSLSQSPLRSTPPRLTHTNRHPQSRGLDTRLVIEFVVDQR